MISRGKIAPTRFQINGYTSTQVDQGMEHVKVTQRAVFTQNVYIAVYTWYIYPVYSRHFAPAAHVLAHFVAQPGQECVPGSSLRRRGRLNDHIHVLIS